MNPGAMVSGFVMMVAGLFLLGLAMETKALLLGGIGFVLVMLGGLMCVVGAVMG